SNTEKPVLWQPIPVGSQLMFSSHSVTAESLLFLFESTLNKPAPPCYLLGIRGTEFSLGSTLSSDVQRAIEQAKLQLAHRLRQCDFS
ncbi:MAG: hypothetical protein D9N11_13470, partial [Ketobacter sp.]